MPQLAVYSDVICPWCYIGKAHMEAALRLLEPGVRFEVSWRPFELNPDMPKAGVERDEYRAAKFGSPDRAREADRQVAAAAEAAGLPIRFDLMRRTPNTRDAHRLLAWSAPRGRQNALVDRLFAAYFVDGADIGRADTLADLAADSGLDREEAAAFLRTSEGDAEIEAEEAAVRRAGLTSVPTFVLGRHVLFSGAVPPDVFAEALGKAQVILSAEVA